ncbi:MAG: MBL fold metallo-hydrolase [Bacteroidota bacterium]|nr:MBL fold metallo-hydrolase [Bacteroidota bacterium]MDP3147333.1 MBL fold metallo-hydrolase [Bacteroidota bacterium]
MKNNIKIQFLGAVETVTGSKYLIQTNDKNILVDCGMFQGLKKLRLLNWEPLPFNVSTIDIVLLTHGHLDHTGYLPRLVKAGFAGPIWGTAPTLEIAKIILEDSAKIQEEDAARANAKGYSKHKPAQPLYDLKDVEKTLPHFNPKPLDKWIEISEGISCRFKYNSHIIGATFIELKIGDKTIVFSGDIGRDNDLLMYPPQKPETADILFIESTYGDRLHPNHSEKQLEEIINTAAKMNGTIIVPGFAVERIQMLMYLLWQLKKKGNIPAIPIYMDSPMGRNVLDIFHHNTSWHKLPADQCTEMCRDIKLIKTMQETLKLATDKSSKIVIAGSGMASGGRVLTYFQQFLGDPSATILLVGYQAEGTRGRQLLEGAKEIKLYGKYYSVKAKIENVEGLSAHADQKGLIDWMSQLKKKPEKIFIVHGEPQSADALRVKIKDVYGWDSVIPSLNEIIKIN